MGYQDSAEKSEAYANAAIATMARKGIAATPPNFMIWYNYHAGHNPDLCRALDVLLSNGQQFTAKCGDAVFEHFFSADTESDSVEAVGNRMEAAIGRIMDAVGDAGDDAEKFGDALKTFSEQLDCQRRSKISPPGRSKTSPLDVMRYAVLGGCPGSP